MTPKAAPERVRRRAGAAGARLGPAGARLRPWARSGRRAGARSGARSGWWSGWPAGPGSWLPRGSSLPVEAWRTRHRAVLWLLLLHAPVIGLVAVLGHRAGPVEASLMVAVPLTGVLLAAPAGLGRTARAAIASCALMLCAAVGVHLAGGATEAHFHFFVLIPVIALYEQWLPFGLGVGFVVVEHAAMGTLLPDDVFPHTGAQRHPMLFALVHGGFFAATAAGCLVNWRLQEVARDRERALADVLRHRVHHDRLTGLPNRDWLLEEAPSALLAERPSPFPLAVLVLDVTGFGEVNDTLGHEVGDELVREVARRLVHAAGPDAVTARIGPDDVVVVLAGPAARHAEAVARRLRTVVTAERVDLGGVGLDVDLVVGVAADDPAPAGDAAADPPAEVRERLLRLLREADVALRPAAAGATGVATYDPDTDSHSVERLALLTDLREALYSDQLQLAYQPKISLAGGEIVGVEALLRWTHPARGAVPPLEFIPAAEATSLVVPLTHRVFTLALLQAAAWADAGLPLRVSVNLPPRLLVEQGFAEVVRSALAATRVPPSRLCLELTETTLMTDAERTLDVIAELHALGVRLSIDDFGTGYSSLSYLRRLPVDELKIDKAFVSGLLQHRQDAILVETTIQLAHRLGMCVVAEGIEDAATAAALAALGCDVGQGYLYSRPLAAADVARWVDGHERTRGRTRRA